MRDMKRVTDRPSAVATTDSNAACIVATPDPAPLATAARSPLRTAKANAPASAAPLIADVRRAYERGRRNKPSLASTNATRQAQATSIAARKAHETTWTAAQKLTGCSDAISTALMQLRPNAKPAPMAAA